MTSPYPAIQHWLIPRSVLVETRKRVQEAGQDVRESGALWLGDRGNAARVLVVVFPRGKGVEERAGKWKVTPEVFGTLTRWAKPQNLSLLAVVHTHLHGVPPRLSRADREYSVQVPGILAIIIGEGGAECDHRNWGWYLYERGNYRRLTAQDLNAHLILDADHFFQTCEADAEAIRELT